MLLSAGSWSGDGPGSDTHWWTGPRLGGRLGHTTRCEVTPWRKDPAARRPQTQRQIWVDPEIWI